MLHSIYGLSQNYSRSEFEILAHLSEVSGAFGKFLFKLKQPEQAIEFLPKMFGWAVALCKKVKGDKANLEEILLTKFPCVCPYCVSAPCACVPGQKRPIEEEKVRAAYHRETPAQGRSLNDFQTMFRKIYGGSWGAEGLAPGGAEAYSAIQKVYTRLIEEISEVGESVRFVHLYPSNFDNELADYLAWIFALVSSVHNASAGRGLILIEDLFWPAYPGICKVCMLDICDCRPSPVRELLSKPSLRDLQFVDGLTHSSNRAQFDNHLAGVADGSLPLPVPIACIRIDIDGFKVFNEAPFDHNIGDQTLKHLATVVRQKIRNRDRLYRVGGDEFAIMCPDLSAVEAEGMMARVAATLRERAVPATGLNGARPPFVSLSIGIAECAKPLEIKATFDRADQEAIRSKNEGKNRISVARPGVAAS